MPAHNHHQSLPGYSPSQIFHDGCEECEDRAKRNDHGMSTLDAGKFRRAWTRAGTRQLHGLHDASHAEIPLLDMLIAVQVRFERLGIPIGELPQPPVVITVDEPRLRRETAAFLLLMLEHNPCINHLSHSIHDLVRRLTPQSDVSDDPTPANAADQP